MRTQTEGPPPTWRAWNAEAFRTDLERAAGGPGSSWRERARASGLALDTARKWSSGASSPQVEAVARVAVRLGLDLTRWIRSSW